MKENEKVQQRQKNRWGVPTSHIWKQIDWYKDTEEKGAVA